jgi:hypothetical protein
MSPSPTARLYVIVLLNIAAEKVYTIERGRLNPTSTQSKEILPTT